MLVPLALFAVAAVLGLIAALPALKGKTPPLVVALLHGAAGASGLVALALSALGPTASGSSRVSLLLFVGAALGGFVLIARHFKKKPLPGGLVLAHGGIAVLAFLVLAVSAFSGS